MADYTSGQINFAGLGNGTDFQTLIDGLVDVESAHKKTLETWKESWENKVTMFQDLGTKLVSLESTLKSLSSMDLFSAKNVTSSKEDKLSATAGSTAMLTSHSIEINQLAKNDIQVTGNYVESLKTPLFTSDGSFTFSYAGESITLSDIPANTTLTGFVNLINNTADSRSKIRATTINSGDGYHLQIYGLDLGEENQLVISNTSGMIFGAGDFLETQNAQNSQIKVDGFPPEVDKWIDRDTNSVDDVIDGVTLNLKETTALNAPVTIGVTTDIDGIKENIKTFVDQNNEVRKMIKELTAVDTSGEKATGSILTGNYGVELLVGQRLKNIISDKGIGFNYAVEVAPDTFEGDMYSALSQLGILTNADTGGANAGMLEIDEDELNEALDKDPDAVVKIFAANYIGESSSPAVQYLSHINGTTEGGAYNIQYTVSGGKLVSATINGNEASVDPDLWQITGKGGTPEAGMAIEVENRSDGTHGTSDADADDALTVDLKVGKVQEMLDALSDMTGRNGPLKILEKNYDSIIKNIEQKIDYEKDRLDLYRQNLKDRYSRLDSLLGRYDQISGQLSSSVNQLSQQ
ncbi:flagellar filament capping protein FliD [Maridesulfovibrio bastinii]|uniref:flagellar filament capping protein FliD n=1 Tax=Maridesulfovibrio bastinii TaxID=47157 RepID=UPI00041B0F66|nr:flagellar filament capping protein FliD [Maridesulfovibrio bastinii]